MSTALKGQPVPGEADLTRLTLIGAAFLRLKS